MSSTSWQGKKFSAFPLRSPRSAAQVDKYPSRIERKRVQLLFFMQNAMIILMCVSTQEARTQPQPQQNIERLSNTSSDQADSKASCSNRIVWHATLHLSQRERNRTRKQELSEGITEKNKKKYNIQARQQQQQQQQGLNAST
jgi:hypothetical protein